MTFFSTLAKTHALTNLPQAKAAAYLIQDSLKVCNALLNIAKAHDQNHSGETDLLFQETISMANALAITDKKGCIETLRFGIAQSRALSNREQAEVVFQKAIDTVNLLPEGQEKVFGPLSDCPSQGINQP